MCKSIKLSNEEEDDQNDPERFKEVFPRLTFLLRDSHKFKLTDERRNRLTPEEYITYLLDESYRDGDPL